MLPFDVIALIAGMLLVAAVAGFSLLPLVIHTRPNPLTLSTSPDADAERQRLYRQVLELEFDHRTGKLSAADYATLSDELLVRAAELLRSKPRTSADVEDALEQEIAAARRARSRRKPVLITARRRAAS